MKKKTTTTKDTQSLSAHQPASKMKNDRALEGDVIQLILRDHQPLKKLIQTLKKSEIERAEKEPTFEEFAGLLIIHAKAEEKSLYVEMKGTPGLRLEGFEGDNEHAIAEQLVQEINATPDDHEWSAKVKVLAESVEHHINEEEEHMLAKVAETLESSDRQKIGDLYTEIKGELESVHRPLPLRSRKIIENRLN